MPHLRSTSSSSSILSSSSISTSTVSSDSDDEDYETGINRRVNPVWESYRQVFERRGFQLETAKDVRRYYETILRDDRALSVCENEAYLKACQADDDALSGDAGLPENLFRGIRIHDGRRVVVKAVCLRSRQFDIVKLLSTSPLRDDPRNHTIPVLDMITVTGEDLGFIVQEEWSSQLIDPNHPCPLNRFLHAIRQCIEGLAFMHAHGIAHLDISLRNILTDFNGRYAFIDFETSRLFTCIPPFSNCTCSPLRYDTSTQPRIHGIHGTEDPPEVERGEESDPFKVDVWALAVVILRACKLNGYDIPQLVVFTRPMLDPSFAKRPSAAQALAFFDQVAPQILFSAIKSTNHQ